MVTNSAPKAISVPLEEIQDRLKNTFQNLKTPEQREKEAIAEYNGQKRLFEGYLGKTIRKEFGERYAKNHQSQEVSIKSHVDNYIVQSMQKGQGYYFAGIPGSGKTHILLEYYIRILESRFNQIRDDRGTFDYPTNYPEWFGRNIRYYYSSWISDMIKNKEKPRVTHYNLIDDFMVEELSGYVLAGWDAYFEEINRRDGVMIISSNVKPEALNKQQYARIASRIAGSCKIIELPTIDRRIKFYGGKQ